MKIGVISDTHGYLPPLVFQQFAGVEKILHAGDVVTEEILIELETIAPVFAARGNTDFYPLAMKLPAVKLLTLNTVNFAIIHNLGNKSNFLARIKSEHPSFNPDVVIYGHTHIKHYEKAYGVHFVNPGCAGNSRCAGQKTGAIIEWKNKDDIRVEFIGLS